MTTTPPTPIRLVLLDRHEQLPGQWPLAGKATYRLGRDQANDLVLPFSWVSRRHAMIQVEENGRHNLIDLGSANGTFVNGRRIYTPTRLRHGDQVSIGKTRLRFENEAELSEGVETRLGGDGDEKTVAFVHQEEITVLICDIHDFTKLSERLGDRRVSSLLQHWTGEVNAIVRRHQGMVDKFIGDAVMALWAGNQDLAAGVRQALRTGLEISRFTGALRERHPELPWPLSIGAALNTGCAMVGNIGVDGHRDFTVVGDVVNVAFRLEAKTSRAEGLDLIIGQEAAAHLGELRQCFTPLRFKVRGKSEPVTAFGCAFDQLAACLDRGKPSS